MSDEGDRKAVHPVQDADGLPGHEAEVEDAVHFIPEAGQVITY